MLYSWELAQHICFILATEVKKFLMVIHHFSTVFTSGCSRNPQSVSISANQRPVFFCVSQSGSVFAMSARNNGDRNRIIS